VTSEPSRERSSTTADYVEGVGKSVALVALLLPVAGVLIRYIAFSTGDLVGASPSQLAYSASVSQLVTTALFGLQLTAIYFAGYFGFVELLHVRNQLVHRRLARDGAKQLRHRPPLERSRWQWLLLRAPLVVMGTTAIVATVLTAVLLALTPDWPYSLIAALGVAAVLLTARVVVRGPERPPRKLRYIWPVAVVGIAIPAVANGLSGTLAGTPVGDYTFSSALASVVSDGKYRELGDANGQLYLQRCFDGRVVRVQTGDLKGVVFQRPTGSGSPSLVDIIAKGKKLTVGFQRSC